MENKLIDSALWLASHGFHVFPLQANSKLPAIKHYPTAATTDEAQIREWWGKRPYCNIGISTSSFNGGESALLAIDVDNKGEKKGDDEIFRLELEGKEFPPTFTQVTPTGGRHFIYRVKEAVRNTASKLAAGIDSRSQGGYVVGTGSVLDGRVYRFEPHCGTITTPAPNWLLHGSTIAKVEKPKATPPAILDAKRAYSRARHWILTAPLAIQGESGDQTTFRTICKLKDFGLAEEVCAEVIEGWNAKCSPPWSAEDLAKKIHNAYAYGNAPIGIDAPETQFSPVVPIDKPVNESGPRSEVVGGDDGGFYLEEMNKKFALIFVKGEHFILHETVDEKNMPTREFMSEASFKRKFSTKTVQEGKGRPRSWAENWLDWPGRREYAGLCFSPGRTPKNNYYNLWRGFAVEPKKYEEASAAAKKGFDMFCEHILQNICGDDKQLAAWLMGYFAQMIQQPYERPLTTLVFRGKKGTGKNAPIDRLGRLLGPRHYLVAHSSRYLTSNFNSHLDSCLCMVLDEAFWSGDKAAEGQLKGVTTAPQIMIEQKGKEPYMVDNLVRWVVIGNENWLVPATEDERRYAVFDVGEGRMQDNAFFAEMRELMDEQGGGSVLLDYLQHFDLSKVDINKAPNTAGLYAQKVATQEPFFDWWLDCLEEGRVLGSDFGDSWPRDVNRESFRQAFTRYATERKISKRIPTKKMFGTLLRECAPGTDFSKKQREGNETHWVYRLPTLQEARAHWDKRMAFNSDWEEHE